MSYCTGSGMLTRLIRYTYTYLVCGFDAGSETTAAYIEALWQYRLWD